MEQDYVSECSSGCESGWTFYLGQSMYPCDSSDYFKNGDYEDDDDDLSMVSDASSGPPHVQQHEQEHEQEQKCNKNGVFNCRKRENMVKGTRKIQENLHCFLADSATSSFFNFSHVGNNQESVERGNNVIGDYSQDDFQSTKFQDQFKPSLSGCQLQQNQLCSTL